MTPPTDDTAWSLGFNLATGGGPASSRTLKWPPPYWTITRTPKPELDPYETAEREDEADDDNPYGAGMRAYAREGDDGLGACPWPVSDPRYREFMKGFIQCKQKTLRAIGEFDHTPEFYAALAEPAPPPAPAIMNEVPDEYRYDDASPGDALRLVMIDLKFSLSPNVMACVPKWIYDPQTYGGMTSGYSILDDIHRARARLRLHSLFPKITVSSKPIEYTHVTGFSASRVERLEHPMLLEPDPRRTGVEPEVVERLAGPTPHLVTHPNYYQAMFGPQGITCETPLERAKRLTADDDARCVDVLDRYRRSHRRTNRW